MYVDEDFAAELTNFAQDLPTCQYHSFTGALDDLGINYKIDGFFQDDWVNIVDGDYSVQFQFDKDGNFIQWLVEENFQDRPRLEEILG